ncbi:hypothetical protein GGQ19_000006 [Salinibacter ruber]|nr:hypothetical protein [Salinibacter ruber]MCS3748855.1 hypothetical protein [Salinibacter ruber]
MDTDVLSVFDIDSRKVSFSEVYACLLRALRLLIFRALRLLIFFDLVLTPKLVLIAVPSNLDSFRFLA